MPTTHTSKSRCGCTTNHPLVMAQGLAVSDLAEQKVQTMKFNAKGGENSTISCIPSYDCQMLYGIFLNTKKQLRDTTSNYQQESSYRMDEASHGPLSFTALLTSIPKTRTEQLYVSIHFELPDGTIFVYIVVIHCCTESSFQPKKRID